MYSASALAFSRRDVSSTLSSSFCQSGQERQTTQISQSLIFKGFSTSQFRWLWHWVVILNHVTLILVGDPHHCWKRVGMLSQVLWQSPVECFIHHPLAWEMGYHSLCYWNKELHPTPPYPILNQNKLKLDANMYTLQTQIIGKASVPF